MIIVLIVPMLSVLLAFGWLQSLLLESHRLQAEWIQVWQQTFLLQSIRVQELTVGVSTSCQSPENITVIHGEAHECWFYRCGADESIQVRLLEK
jgi:hypothetical protein